MAQTVQADKAFVVHPSDIRVHGFGFGHLLASGITISSVTSTIVTAKVSGGDTTLTATSGAVLSSVSADSLGVTIAANEGVSATVKLGTAGSDYYITVIVVTSDSETITGVFEVQCRSS